MIWVVGKGGEGRAVSRGGGEPVPGKGGQIDADGVLELTQDVLQLFGGRHQRVRSLAGLELEGVELRVFVCARNPIAKGEERGEREGERESEGKRGRGRESDERGGRRRNKNKKTKKQKTPTGRGAAFCRDSATR